MKSRFIIDLLGIEKGKAYGYQEYIFNLLNYFYSHRQDIYYSEIIIWCKDISQIMFEPYRDKFEIISFSCPSYLKRFYLQSFLPFKYKLSYSDLLFSPGNTAGFLKKGKWILTIHDLLFKRKLLLQNRLMRFQREIMLPISIRNADKIVAISQFTKNDVEHYYPKAKGKIVKIYNSFNFGKYEGKEIANLGFEYFIAISTNADYKNQKTILKSFHKYCDRGGDKCLVIIGKVNDKTEAGQIYESLPNDVRDKIIWKNNISNSELGSLYRGASCFISASKFEGLGMPIVEAMSFGLPVLLSDIPPHREVSLNKGVYFEPEDVDALSDYMTNMVFEKQNYGLEIRTMFSEENTSAKYIELINEIYTKSVEMHS